jgi:hypothetical protein
MIGLTRLHRSRSYMLVVVPECLHQRAANGIGNQSSDVDLECTLGCLHTHYRCVIDTYYATLRSGIVHSYDPAVTRTLRRGAGRNGLDSLQDWASASAALEHRADASHLACMLIIELVVVAKVLQTLLARVGVPRLQLLAADGRIGSRRERGVRGASGDALACTL